MINQKENSRVKDIVRIKVIRRDLNGREDDRRIYFRSWELVVTNVK